MSQSNVNEPQDFRPDDEFESQLRDQASSFSYPPTSDVAGKVARRLRQPNAAGSVRRALVWAVLLILLALCGLIVVPEVRASILNWLRIGSVRILLTEPTPSTPVAPTAVPLVGTPANRDLNRLAGRMTLAQARQRVRFAIPLPTYPENLGEPDYVYVQDFGGALVMLIWVDHHQPDRILLNLQILSEGVSIDKINPVAIQRTKVNGSDAVWAVGPYMLHVLRNGQVDTDMLQLVVGNTLIWTAGDLTYRLESSYTLEEAVKIAEALR